MNKKFISISFMMLLILSAMAIFVPQNASATTTNNTWISDGASYSGIGTNWQNGSLTTGQNVWFTSAHVGNCIWNNSLGVTTFGSFIIRSGAITITQAASFSVTSYSQAAGTFTGSTIYTLTDSGNFVITSGTITSHILRLIMQTDSTAITLGTDFYYFYQLTINGNVSLTNSFRGTWNANSGIWIANEKTLTISTGKTLGWFTRGTWSNLGIITGGTILFQFYDADLTAFVLGIVNSVIIFQTTNDATALRSCTLGANAVFGNILTINSLHGTYTTTLNLNGYSLTAAGITIGTRGIITGGTSTITDSAEWDSSASSNVASSLSSVKVHLTGTTKTFKQSSSERIGSLFFDTGSSYTLQSNVYCINYWLNGTVTKVSYTVYVNNNQAPIFTAYDSSKWIDWFSSYTYTFMATDRETETLTFAKISSMPGLTIGSSSGIALDNAPITNGTWDVHISVTDGNHTTWKNYTLDIRYTPINAINRVGTIVTNLNINLTTQINRLNTAIINLASNLTTQSNRINTAILNQYNNLTAENARLYSEIANLNTNSTTGFNRINQAIYNQEINISLFINYLNNSFTNSTSNSSNITIITIFIMSLLIVGIIIIFRRKED